MQKDTDKASFQRGALKIEFEPSIHVLMYRNEGSFVPPQNDDNAVQRDGEIEEEGAHDDVGEDENEDDAEDAAEQDGEAVVDTQEEEALLEENHAGADFESDCTDNLRKRGLKKTDEVMRPSEEGQDDDEDEMNISPLLADETEPKKNK